MTGLGGYFANYQTDEEQPDVPQTAPAVPQDAYSRYQAYLGQTATPAAPAPAAAPTGPLRGEALNQDVARTVLQKGRELIESSVALPGNVVMAGAKLGNVVARNYPQLGLKEVPEDVLRQNIPWPTSPQLEQKTTEGLAWVRRNFPSTGLGQLVGARQPTEEEVKSFAEPHQAKSTLAKGVGGIVEYAPAALAVSNLIPGLVKKGAQPALRTLENLKGEERTAWQAARDAGQNLTGQQYAYVVNKADQAAQKFGANAIKHPDTMSILDDLKARLARGEIPSSDEFNALRGQLSDTAFSAPKAADRTAASHALHAFDNATETVSANYPLFKQARAATTVYERSRAVEKVFNQAQLRADRTGQDFGQILRAKFETLANNETRMRQFPPDMRQAITDFVAGGKLENFATKMSKSAITGQIPATILGYFTGGGVGAFGGPATSAAVRAGLRGVAGRETAKAAQGLRTMAQRSPLSVGGVPPALARSVASGTVSLADFARQFNISQEQAAELIKESLKQSFAAQQP